MSAYYKFEQKWKAFFSTARRGVPVQSRLPGLLGIFVEPGQCFAAMRTGSNAVPGSAGTTPRNVLYQCRANLRDIATALSCHFLEDPPRVQDTGFRYFRSNVSSRPRDVICRMLFLADCFSRIKF